jgi:hypothetical protein
MDDDPSVSYHIRVISVYWLILSFLPYPGYLCVLADSSISTVTVVLKIQSVVMDHNCGVEMYVFALLSLPFLRI